MVIEKRGERIFLVRERARYDSGQRTRDTPIDQDQRNQESWLRRPDISKREGQKLKKEGYKVTLYLR